MRHVPDVAELVQLVHAAPHRAAMAAQARLAAIDWADARERAQLHWVVGQAEREQGRLEPAKATLKRASALAASAGDADLSSRIQSSLAFVIARQGDLDGAHELLVDAEKLAGPLQRARLLAQRGVVAHLRGELDDAAEMLATATEILKRHGDHIAEARHRANLGAVLAERGPIRSGGPAFAPGDRDRPGARSRRRRRHRQFDAGIHGDSARRSARGDSALHRSGATVRAAGADSYLGRVNADHAKALGDAGLLDDAAVLLSRALDLFRGQGQRTELGAGLLASAEILLASGDGDGARAAADAASATLAEQRRWRWVTLATNLALQARATLDDHLYAVSVSARRAQLHDLGSADGIGGAIDALSFAMSRLNRTQGSTASRRAAAELFDATAIELAERLVPAVVAHSSRPVVIVPTALLHDVPWGVLAPFGRRAVTVDPSISAWARAQRCRAERHADRGALGSIGFIAGPGLEHAEREVAQHGTLYRHPRVVTGSESTVPVCLDLFAKSDVVHLACHGTFRTDNPMFSALRLADGQLVVYDFERLDRLPQVVVMSACSVANSKAVQGGSFLGLAAALTTLGASSVVAPLSPISDASSVEVMLRLHEAMLAGSSPAEALAIAASDVSDGLATAGAFVALGS